MVQLAKRVLLDTGEVRALLALLAHIAMTVLKLTNAQYALMVLTLLLMKNAKR